MRKFLILLVSFTFVFNAYPFWIWSPKTKKWKNPKYSPLATPFLQFKQAEKYFNDKRYKEAYKEFKKLLIHYPDSKQAAEAQYYLGRCLEKMNQSYQAFLEYTKVIESYPNSQQINEVVERQYAIGEYFLEHQPKHWLGVSVYDFVEHPALEIFRKIVEKVPYSAYASRAQYKLGILLFQLGRFEEAKDAFQKVIDNYPDSEWAASAKYQLALATSKAYPGVGYDSTALKEATQRLDEFVKTHPEAGISEQAQKQLQELRDKEAKKNFDTAQFYEKQRQFKAAATYYRLVIDKYPESDYTSQARGRLSEIEEKTR